jgi:sulfate/thiosulfate transport system permease protein
MAGGPSHAVLAELRTRPGRNTWQAHVARWIFISLSVSFLAALLIAPLVAVFGTALSAGFKAYFMSFGDPDTLSAIRLTLLTAAIVVPLNTLFGVAAAWAIAKFEFKGKSVLITLIDLPIAVSPVIAGLIYVLVYGVNGWFGTWLVDRDLNVIFAVPGIVLATLFVTIPYVARELIPLMQQLGNNEEEAAISLGAGGLMTFFRVTLPKIRWGLLYGVILCNARAMGEFGAVTVVSGRIRGMTSTMPLQIEMLYEDHKAMAAFALASLLTMLAVVTLVVKTAIEWRGASK